jgi:signal transduction histidine kinase
VLFRSGEGIAPEHLDRVFDRFYRVEQARTRRGAGLGLAIARKVIALHGGEITVASTPGAGSTFTVWLPLG